MRGMRLGWAGAYPAAVPSAEAHRQMASLSRMVSVGLDPLAQRKVEKSVSRTPVQDAAAFSGPRQKNWLVPICIGIVNLTLPERLCRLKVATSSRLVWQQ